MYKIDEYQLAAKYRELVRAVMDFELEGRDEFFVHDEACRIARRNSNEAVRERLREFT